jgi:hypothetical protein
MVTDQQVRRLFKLNQTEKNFGIAAMKFGTPIKQLSPKNAHSWQSRSY